MSEVTLNKPLSGREVIDAILYDIREALLRDGRLAAHLAFPAYAFTATLTIRTPGNVSEGFTRPLQGSGGNLDKQVEAVVQGTAETLEVIAEREVQPPNDVRYETEQPIPLLVTEDNGRVREEYKSYKGRTRGGKPKVQPGVKKSEIAEVVK